MFGIGPMELVLILVVALLVFGPKRLPELARTLGRGLGEFRRASNDLRQSLALDDIQNDLRRNIQSTLSDSQTIHKPDADRPAQAGDGLDLPSEQAAAEAEAKGKAPSEAGDSAADTPSPTDPGPRAHPGELPFGDETAHHDEPEEADEPDREAAVPSASTADSELGSVPVSGSTPADPRRG